MIFDTVSRALLVYTLGTGGKVNKGRSLEWTKMRRLRPSDKLKWK